MLNIFWSLQNLVKHLSLYRLHRSRRDVPQDEDSSLTPFFSRQNLKPLFLMCFIMIFQQCTAVNAVCYVTLHNLYHETNLYTVWRGQTPISFSVRSDGVGGTTQSIYQFAQASLLSVFEFWIIELNKSKYPRNTSEELKKKNYIHPSSPSLYFWSFIGSLWRLQKFASGIMPKIVFVRLNFSRVQELVPRTGW